MKRYGSWSVQTRYLELLVPGVNFFTGTVGENAKLRFASPFHPIPFALRPTKQQTPFTSSLPFHTPQSQNKLMAIVVQACSEAQLEAVDPLPLDLHLSAAPPSSLPSPSPSKSPSSSSTSSSTITFATVSICYLLFTITDGAIRMIVLMFAYERRFSALEVAIMFSAYELAGVFTNIIAGYAAGRYGIRATLLTGLFLQICNFCMLYAWNSSWSNLTAIIYVTCAGTLGGVAKDLTKLGGKTVTKLVTPKGRDTKLFKLVSKLTGWKNSLKGVGYFVGAASLAVSYEFALGLMVGILVAALPPPIFFLSTDLGRIAQKDDDKKSWFSFLPKFSDVFNSKNPSLNFLSAARLFLFASRDFWFEVPLPFYLRSPSCTSLGPSMSCASSSSSSPSCSIGATCSDLLSYCVNLNPGGGCGGLAFPKVYVGALLAGYIILYGQVQSLTPNLVTGPLKQNPPNKLTEVLWGVINLLPTAIGAAILYASPSFSSFGDERSTTTMTILLVAIVLSFGVIFAINSSIHSYLVVKYARGDKVAVDVGFYYMSNALGRLFGSIGSGILYTYAGGGEVRGQFDVYGMDATWGLASCFVAGTVCSVVAVMLTVFINDEKGGLACGRIVCVKEKEKERDVEKHNLSICKVLNL